MLQKLNIIWLFYKQFFLASFLANFLMFFISIPLFTTIIFKIFFFGTFLFWQNIKDNKTPFVFYQNLGISIRELLIGAVIIDSLLVTACYKLIGFAV